MAGRGFRLCLALPCALCVALLLAAPAGAVRGHVFAQAFGEAGSGAGQFAEPFTVAVGEADGEVYVVDSGNNRVERFSAAGFYEGEFNGSGGDPAVEGKAAPDGRFLVPNAIAVDNDPGSPSFGDVYVHDRDHEVIDKFSATGAYIGELTETTGGTKFPVELGMAVDENGTLWFAWGKSSELEITSFGNAVTNEFLSSVKTELNAQRGGVQGEAFAVDSEGDFYIGTSSSGVTKLSSSLKELIPESDSLVASPVPLAARTGVAVDLVDNEALGLAHNEVYIGSADGEQSVGRFTSSGSLVEKFGSEHLVRSRGVAVDGATGAVYVADPGADDVAVFALESESPPTIEEEASLEVTDSSAKLESKIRLGGLPSTYYVQYGTASCASEPSACTDLPAAPGTAIGSGFETTSVAVRLQGLAAQTTYHYRVVAVNALGSTAGAEGTFTTQTGSTTLSLPDGREWELVTPPNKQGAGLIPLDIKGGADIQAAQDGGGFTYGTTAPIVANPQGSRSVEVTQAISTRTAPGSWETEDIATPHNEGPIGLVLGHTAEYKLFSADLSAGLVEPAGDTPLPPLPAGSEKTVYIRRANGSYEALVTAANVPAGTKFGGDEIGAGGVTFITATPDFKHVMLESNAGVKLSTAPGDNGNEVYEWSDGQLLPASILPDGEFTEAVLGDNGFGDSGNVRHAVSDNGSRIVFERITGPSFNGFGPKLYLASGESVPIDAAQGVSEPVERNFSVYQTANAEGSRVFFTSRNRLTANASESPIIGTAPGIGDLYVFETDNASGSPLAGRLTDLTVDGNVGEHAEVLGVIGASEDGTSVYFVADGALGRSGATHGNCHTTGEQTRERCNLYDESYDQASGAWGAPVLVATLSGVDSHTWGAGARLTSRVSPDGRYLAFMSERSLTGYDNRDAVSGVPDEEVFLYDASSKRLVCASCNPTGARPDGIKQRDEINERLIDYGNNWGGQWLAANIPGWTSESVGSALYQSRYLSDSGRLFFDSSDALVPADVDGTEDVYEFEPLGVGGCRAGLQSAGDVYEEAIGGCVALISSGASAEESAFLDASETGSDVFFMTAARLVPQDIDTAYDVYDAHECSVSSPCAPPPAQPAPACDTGDSCKPASTPQPAIFGSPASATFSGPGNPSPPSSSSLPSSRTATKSLTRAQLLARALKACNAKPRRARAACRKRARQKHTKRGVRR